MHRFLVVLLLAFSLVDLACVSPRSSTPPPVATTGPIRSGRDAKAPVALHRVDPVYPAEAMKDKMEGAVTLQATIDRTGRVRDVQVLKGLPDGLSEAAVDALRQWTFAPGTLNGQPVEVIYNVTLTFHRK
jgi:TonB family protein